MLRGNSQRAGFPRIPRNVVDSTATYTDNVGITVRRNNVRRVKMRQMHINLFSAEGDRSVKIVELS